MNHKQARTRPITFDLLILAIVGLLFSVGTIDAQEEPDEETTIFTQTAITEQPYLVTENGVIGPGFIIEDEVEQPQDAREARLERSINPSPSFAFAEATQTADIVVTYVGDWPTEAQAAFEYAVTIWERRVTSSVPIEVQASWGPLLGNTIGSAGAVNLFRDFSGAPVSNTWYPIALANALIGEDAFPANPDISATLNSNFAEDYYFGLDANPGFNEIDFVTLVLHELGHGLGFFGSVRGDPVNQTATWGNSSGFPYGYDRFTENNAGQAFISFTSGSGALYDQVTTAPIFFDGPLTNAANGETRAQLFTSDPWVQGRSYSHLNFDTYVSTENRLMVPTLIRGTATHDPGPVMLAIFEDIGWTIADIPELELGDVSCDLAITTADALFILQFNVGLRTSLSTCPVDSNTQILLQTCDVSGDNICNTTDALQILQCNVGLTNEFCPAVD